MEKNTNHRLAVKTVEQLHGRLGENPVTEAMTLRFIGARWGVRNFIHLPAKVAANALWRTADFIRAAKQYCEPELPF